MNFKIKAVNFKTLAVNFKNKAVNFKYFHCKNTYIQSNGKKKMYNFQEKERKLCAVGLFFFSSNGFVRFCKLAVLAGDERGEIVPANGEYPDETTGNDEESLKSVLAKYEAIREIMGDGLLRAGL